MAAKLPTRAFGSTGEQVSLLGLGGYHLAFGPKEAEAVRIVRHALDEGITFLDNCWDYNEGRSEEWMGKALRDGYRQRAFLMTKIDGRTKESAAAQIDQSLRRLQTDRIDLIQIHEVIRARDPRDCFAPGGCIEALVEAKQAGKLRYVGFTGHKDPDFHLAMLAEARRQGFRFDAVQMPLNVLDAHFKSFERKVLPELLRDGLAVLGMKPMAAGQIVKSGAATAEECLRYALSLPTSVVITGCDSSERLEQALRVGRSFQPLGDAERAALLSRTAPYASAGKLEGFKTTGEFDGTDQNPHWLTEARL